MRHSIKKIFSIVLIILCFVNMKCEESDNDVVNSSCDFISVIDKTQYDNLDTANFKFINVEIVDDCIIIKIGASGCSGDNWGFNLVDSGVVAESSPEQRYLKFELVNDEACLAYFERTISFDLLPLQVNGSNEIILHIENVDSSLNYKY